MERLPVLASVDAAKSLLRGCREGGAEGWRGGRECDWAKGREAALHPSAVPPSHPCNRAPGRAGGEHHGLVKGQHDLAAVVAQARRKQQRRGAADAVAVAGHAGDGAGGLGAGGAHAGAARQRGAGLARGAVGGRGGGGAGAGVERGQQVGQERALGHAGAAARVLVLAGGGVALRRGAEQGKRRRPNVGRRWRGWRAAAAQRHASPRPCAASTPHRTLVCLLQLLYWSQARPAGQAAEEVHTPVEGAGKVTRPLAWPARQRGRGVR